MGPTADAQALPAAEECGTCHGPIDRLLTCGLPPNVTERSRSGGGHRSGFFVGGNTLAPRDFGNAFHAARRLDDLLQVREVLHFDER